MLCARYPRKNEWQTCCLVKKQFRNFPCFSWQPNLLYRKSLNTRIRRIQRQYTFTTDYRFFRGIHPGRWRRSHFFSYKDAITREVHADSCHEDQRDCARGFHGSFERSARTSTSVAARSRPTRAHAVSHRRRRRRHLAPYPLEITLNLSTTLRALQGTGWRRWLASQPSDRDNYRRS